eukprot:Awhi_evm1s5542
MTFHVTGQTLQREPEVEEEGAIDGPSKRTAEEIDDPDQVEAKKLHLQTATEGAQEEEEADGAAEGEGEGELEDEEGEVMDDSVTTAAALQ